MDSNGGIAMKVTRRCTSPPSTLAGIRNSGSIRVGSVYPITYTTTWKAMIASVACGTANRPNLRSSCESTCHPLPEPIVIVVSKSVAACITTCFDRCNLRDRPIRASQLFSLEQSHAVPHSHHGKKAKSGLLSRTQRASSARCRHASCSRSDGGSPRRAASS